MLILLVALIPWHDRAVNWHLSRKLHRILSADAAQLSSINSNLISLRDDRLYVVATSTHSLYKNTLARWTVNVPLYHKYTWCPNKKTRKGFQIHEFILTIYCNHRDNKKYHNMWPSYLDVNLGEHNWNFKYAWFVKSMKCQVRKIKQLPIHNTYIRGIYRIISPLDNIWYRYYSNIPINWINIDLSSRGFILGICTNYVIMFRKC